MCLLELIKLAESSKCRVHSSTTRLKDAALMLLSTMIEHEQLNLDDNLLDVMLNFVRQHVRRHVCPHGAVSVLRAIIKRKLQSPQLYDLMLALYGNMKNMHMY